MENLIWVYIDHFQGNPSSTSWEALGAARSIADDINGEVTALVFGSKVEKIADEAIARGAGKVLLADDVSLLDFRPEPYTAVLVAQVQEANPHVIFFPNTIRGRELAGMAAVDLKTGVLPDAISIEMIDGRIFVTRPVFAGKLLAKVTCSANPQLVTVRARSFVSPTAEYGRSGDIQSVLPELTETKIDTTVEKFIEPETRISLSDATVVISGGRGLANNLALQPPPGLAGNEVEKWRAQQGFKLLFELAEVLGGAVGASRAAVDAGYIPYSHQVGQTGKIVSPDLYIACGISGAIQHLAGMRTSKVIVAINRDMDAPIFKYARFGVVGDLFEVVPALTEAIRARLAK